MENTPSNNFSSSELLDNYEPLSSLTNILGLEGNADLRSVNNYPYQQPGPVVSFNTPKENLEITDFYNPGDIYKNVARPATREALYQPIKFDGQAENIDRFIESDNFNVLGFRPGEDNETRYGRNQSWGDVLGNAFAGGARLAGQTFVEGWKGWGYMTDALFSWDSKKLAGSEEDLAELYKDQQAIMNKYAIYSTPEGRDGFFNREFFGSMVQQSGFAIGATAQFLSEELLTLGFSTAFSGAKLGVTMGARALRAAETADKVNDLRKLGNIWKSNKVVNAIYDGAKRFVPFAKTAEDLYVYGKAGASASQMAAIGIGGIKRTLAEANMAMSEARMEAAGTYGDLSKKLNADYFERTGLEPDDAEKDKISKLALQAAQENFTVNTGIIMLSNKIQFDNLFNKFGTERRILKAMGQYGDDVLKVSGKTLKDGVEKPFTQIYEKGMLGAAGQFGKIAKDFGSGVARWELAKSLGRGVFKWEVSEGIQEILQDLSNKTLQDYYYDMYHGTEGYSYGRSLNKAVEEVQSKEGFKTFLMGALTGRLISPLTFAIETGAQRLRTSEATRTKAALDKTDTINILNQFYKDPAAVLKEEIANFKTQEAVAVGMNQGAQLRDQYIYQNFKDSGFAKMMSAAKKTDMFPSVLDHIREYGENLTPDEFQEAFNIDPKEYDIQNPKTYFNEIADKAESFAKNWEELSDRYGELVMPSLFEEGTPEYFEALINKKALDDAIEILATNKFKSERALIRAQDILSKAQQNRNIGNSSATAFNMLGDMDKINKELELLEASVANLKAFDNPDQATKDLLKTKTAQIEQLNNWMKNWETLTETNSTEKKQSQKAINAYAAYLNSKNEESGLTATVSLDDIKENYEYFVDFVELNKDHGVSIDAYNVLANPRNFTLFHRKAVEAIIDTREKLKEEHIKEATATPAPPVAPVAPVAPSPVVTAADSEQKGLAPGMTVIKTVNGVSLVKFEDETTTELIGYLITDLDTNFVNVELDDKKFPDYSKDSMYESEQRATEIFNAVVAKVKKTAPEAVTPYTFDGKTIKKGDVFYDEKGRKHIVETNKEPVMINGLPHIKLKDVSSQGRMITTPHLKGLTAEADFNKATEVVDPNAFRLKRTNELNRIYAVRQRDENALDAEERLKNLIVNTPEQEWTDNITIVITKNNNEGKMPFPAGDGSNPKLEQNREPFAIAVQFKGQTIGFMTYYDAFSYIMGDGRRVPLNQLSDKQFQQIFDVDNKDVSRTYTEFKNSFKQSRDAHAALIQALGNQESVTLSGKELSKYLNVFPSTGSYAFVDKPVAMLEELEYNTLDGFTYVIDRPRVYLSNGMFSQEDGTVITDSTDTTALDQRVKEARFEGGEDKLAKMGRYIAVVNLPNGKVRFVELTSPVMTTAEIDAIATEVAARSVETKAKNLGEDASQTFNDAYNRVLTQKLFIALPVNKQGISVNMFVNSKGSLQLEFFDKNKSGGNATRNVVIKEMSDADALSLKDGKHLIARINQAIKEHDAVAAADNRLGISLSEKNFKRALTEVKIEEGKKVVRRDIFVSEARQMMAGVDKSVVKNPGLLFVAGANRPKAETPVAKKVPEKTPAPAPKAEEETLTVQEEASLNEIIAARRGDTDGKKTITSQIFDLKQKKNNLLLEIHKELRATGLKQAEINKQALKDSRYLAILNQISDLERSVADNRNIAKKIVTDLSKSEVENIDVFKNWVKESLPDYINVDELSNLVNGLKEKSITVGQFVAQLSLLDGKKVVTGGSIQVGENTPYKYHEAFHAVFRLLLKENKINQLLDIARVEMREKGISLAQAKKDLVALKPDFYGGLSEKELEERALEEYMADMFDAWKTNIKTPTSSINKSFFRRLLDFIKSIFKAIKNNPIESLFADIEAGKYKSAAIQNNRFTTENMMGVTEPALKAIQITEKVIVNEEGQDEIIPVYLSQQEGNIITSSIAALFHKRVQTAALGVSVNGMLEEIMDQYAELYAPDKAYYQSDAFIEQFDNPIAYEKAIEKLNHKYLLFSDPSLREILLDAVKSHIRLMGYKEILEEEDFNQEVDDFGDRATTEKLGEKASIGGFGSLSGFLRKYIATAYNEVTDEYGQSYLVEPTYDEEGNVLDPGTPLIRAVDANTVYNGILKAVSNLNSDYKILQRLMLFSETNPETKTFVDKFISDTGLVIDTENETFDITNKENALLFQNLIKGFNQYSVNYLMINKDIKKRVTKIYNVNQKDAARNQFAIWYNAYLNLFENVLLQTTPGKDRTAFLNSRKKALNLLSNLLDPSKKVLTNEALNEQAIQISNGLKDQLGINLSPLYIKYSYTKILDPESLTLEMRQLNNSFDKVYAITRQDAQEIINTVSSGQNPFGKNVDPEKLKAEREQRKESEVLTSDEEVDLTTDEEQGGNVTRLQRIAGGNVIFDESVLATSFKNPADELVYAHQLPTFDLVMATTLQQEDYRNNLKKDPFLKNNFLLNNPLFNYIANQFKIERIGGIKSSSFTKTEDNQLVESKSLEINRNKGITYGDMSDREFAISLIELYASNEKFYAEGIEGVNDGEFYTAKHLMGVLEASNTGDVVSLPVIKAVKMGNKGRLTFTAVAKEALLNEIKTEFSRIQRVQDEIDNGYPNGIIDGYHNGNPEKGGLKGLRFFKMKNMLGKELATKMEAAAIKQEPIDGFVDSINQQLEKYWFGEGGLVDAFISNLEKQKIIVKSKSDNRYFNELLDSFIEKGFVDEKGRPDKRKNGLMNIIPNNTTFNLAQVLVNDYINTLSVNQMIQGDPAELFKDDGGIDEVKRYRGRNAGGASIVSHITAPELGINHANLTSHVLTFDDIMYQAKFAGGTKEKTDAQMYMTEKALRYTLFGLGKLSKAQAEILDKVQRGESFSAADIFGSTGNNRKTGSIKYNAQTNSIKLVYYDGKKYVKISGVMLSKQLTSVFDTSTGTWIPRVNNKELHDMRMALEKFEEQSVKRDPQGNITGGTIAMAVPKSGSKQRRVNIVKNISDVYDNDGNVKADSFVEHDNRFWRLQLENPSNKVQITDPTQAKQIILAEQDDATEVYFPWNEEGKSVITVGELKKIYLKQTAQRLKNNYFKSRDDIFDIDDAFRSLDESINLKTVKPKLKKFLDRAVDQLSAQGADTQLIEFFKAKDGVDKYDLNNNLTLDMFTKLFLSYFSKGVMSEKVPGDSVALMSNYGMRVVKRVVALDQNGQPSQWEIVRTAAYDQDPSKYNNAKDWSNADERTYEGLQVGDFFVDDLRHNVPEYDKDGNIIGRYTEFMMPPHIAELMGLKPGDPIPEAIAKAFGVRIPSQDKHSMITLKLVDFLPAHYGSTAVFPHELIEISGADFDIDKLYIQYRDTYLKDGKVTAYGSAKSDTEKFAEYIEYLRKKDNNFKAKLSELKKLDFTGEDVEEMDIDSEFTYDSLLAIADDLKSNLTTLRYEVALQELGLPHTPALYKSFVKENGEINNGVLNNIILDAKIALLNNEHMTKGELPIAFQVATVKPLMDLIEVLKVQFPVLKPILEEGTTDLETLGGKISAFKNNKEGAKGIGPAVNAMQVYAVLNSFGIKLRETNGEGKDLFRLNIDGKYFDSYANTKAFNSETDKNDGERIFFILSAITSAMTDNAKERLAAKLGMNVEAIGIVANMISLGVPLQTAISYVLQPAVREFYKQIAAASYNVKTSSEDKIIKSRVGRQLLEEYAAVAGDSLTEMAITTELLNDNITTNGQNASVQHNILAQFLKFRSQTEFFSSVAQIIKLTKGPGTNFEDLQKIEEAAQKLGLDLNDTDFSNSDIIFDIRQVLTGKKEGKANNDIIATNYKIFKQAFQKLTKTVFLEKTDVFKKLEATINANFDVDGKFRSVFDKTLKRDLISYLSIKAYMHQLKERGAAVKLKGLDNALIYDADAIARGEDFADIIDTVKSIRATLKNNYFANNFLNIIPTTITDYNTGEVAFNPTNRGGINVAESNSWAKLGPMQIEKLQESFLEIYSNEKTRAEAITLFNYLLVKDGGQFKSGSFISFIPNAMFKELMDATGLVVEIMKISSSNEAYQKVFGVNAPELFDEFVQIYSTNINNNLYTKAVYIGATPSAKDMEALPKVAKHSPNKVITVQPDKTLVIDLFADIRKQEYEEVQNAMTGRMEFVPLKKTGKFSEEEINKLVINKAHLAAKRINNIETVNDEGNKITELQFPYTIKVIEKTDFTQMVAAKPVTYVLKKVGKEKLDKKVASPSDLLDNDNLMASGVYAVYVPIDLKGSKKQTAIGGMYGQLPSTEEVMRKRTAFNNSKRFGFAIDNVDIDSVGEDVFFASSPTIADLDSNYELNSGYGISYRVVGSEFIFSKNGKPYATTAKTPAALLAELGGPVSTAETVSVDENIPAFQDIPMPTEAPLQAAGVAQADAVDTGAAAQVAIDAEKAKKNLEKLLALRKAEIEKQKEEKDKGCKP